LLAVLQRIRRESKPSNTRVSSVHNAIDSCGPISRTGLRATTVENNSSSLPAGKPRR